MSKIKDRNIKLGFQAGLLFLAAQILILLFFWQKLPPQVPLLFSRSWGENQLVNPTTLLILPIISFLVNITNLVIALFLSQKEKLASELLVIFGSLFNLLCLITLFKIVLLVV